MGIRREAAWYYDSATGARRPEHARLSIVMVPLACSSLTHAQRDSSSAVSPPGTEHKGHRSAPAQFLLELPNLLYGAARGLWVWDKGTPAASLQNSQKSRNPELHDSRVELVHAQLYYYSTTYRMLMLVTKYVVHLLWAAFLRVALLLVRTTKC